VLSTLAKGLNLRTIPTGTGVTTVSAARGSWLSVSVRTEEFRFLRVHLGNEAGAELEEVALPLVAEVRTAAGVVEHSVSQALSGTPQGAALVQDFADIFQWDIDLLIDPRTGDEIRVVYQSLVYGSLPEDLPPLKGRMAESGGPAGTGRILAAAYRGAVANSSAYWVRGADGVGNYFDSAGIPLRKTFLKSPLNYRRISSSFSRSRRNPVTRKVVPHHGVDFAANSGTPVVAAADGRVKSVGWSGALGKAVKIRHGSGYTTVYGHLRGYAKGVRAGATVRQNQVIGYVGSTGRATGPHLHYTMLVAGKPVNPMTFRNPPVEELPESDRHLLEEAVTKWQPSLFVADQPS
jgi:hypothetical protein